MDEYRAEYDKLVAQILKAADDKSASDIKKADKALKEFDAQLKKAKDNTKDLVKDCPWEASRAAALKGKQEFEQLWGQQQEIAAVRQTIQTSGSIRLQREAQDKKQKQPSTTQTEKKLADLESESTARSARPPSAKNLGNPRRPPLKRLMPSTRTTAPHPIRPLI